MPPDTDGRPRARPPDAAGEPWRISRLLAAPHRLAFFCGALLLAVASLWWLAALVDGQAVVSLPWALAPGHAHALLMSFSYMPMFFAGFVCTAGPRWLELPGVDARELVPIAGLWVAGWAACLAGAHLQAPVAAVGLALVAASWSAFCTRFVQMLLESRVPDRLHLGIIAGACVLGALAMWVAATAVALGEAQLLHRLVPIGLWWFIAPVFVAAVHRMVPFFGVAATALDERVPNGLLLVGLVLVALQPLAGANFAAATAWHAALAVLDAGAALSVALLLVRWRKTQNLGIRLLAMLWVGFAWLGIAFALQAVHAGLLAAGSAAVGVRLAALHALGMGFFGSTMIAMVSRVTCGQAGRTLNAERWVWRLFLVLQAAAALRILTSLGSGGAPVLLVATALLWAVATVAWSLRYMSWYGRPRADGRAG